MSSTSYRPFSDLRMASAYVKLSCIPEDNSEALVSLALIGNYEIRMFRGPEADFDRAPLFWLELFDHGMKTSVDGSSCRTINDAVSIFDDFISQVFGLSKPCGAHQ
jgi:hypothetical protein